MISKTYEGTLVKIIRKQNLNYEDVANCLFEGKEGQIPFTKFEMILKGTSESKTFVFPMHLDQQLEGQEIEFRNMGSACLDGQTSYRLTVTKGKNEGMLYDSGEIPIYIEEKVLKHME